MFYRLMVRLAARTLQGPEKLSKRSTLWLNYVTHGDQSFNQLELWKTKQVAKMLIPEFKDVVFEFTNRYTLKILESSLLPICDNLLLNEENDSFTQLSKAHLACIAKNVYKINKKIEFYGYIMSLHLVKRILYICRNLDEVWLKCWEVIVDKPRLSSVNSRYPDIIQSRQFIKQSKITKLEISQTSFVYNDSEVTWLFNL